MQMFEQYNLSEAACQFAITALEQVEEALGSTDGSVVADPHVESTIAVKGRLWANVFKFALDLNYYYDAYCALISNPDEESKSICLRRFIIVLYERGAMKVLFQLLFCSLVFIISSSHSILSSLGQLVSWMLPALKLSLEVSL